MYQICFRGLDTHAAYYTCPVIKSLIYRIKICIEGILYQWETKIDTY